MREKNAGKESMTFSKERIQELLEKMQKIWTDCMLKAKAELDDKYVQEEYFMKEVFNAGLIEGNKQLFLLGALAQKFHDIAPRATLMALDVMEGKRKESDFDN